MKNRKYIAITLMVIMIAVIALSVNTALAAGSGKTAPPSDPLPDIHPPVCYQIDSLAPGIYELQCYDTGKDIVDVKVVTANKYELFWNNEAVTLRVYTNDLPGSRGYWAVSDKSGHKVSGNLP